MTWATLDAATKYPWPRSPEGRKYGVYPDDMLPFGWLREGAPGERRCIEAQVMDWADDIAYSVHDFEDAIHAGHLSFAALLDGRPQALIDLTQDRYATWFDWGELEAARPAYRVALQAA